MQILEWLCFLFCLVIFVTSTYKALKNSEAVIELGNSEDPRDLMLATMFARQSILWCVFWGVLTALSFKGL